MSNEDTPESGKDLEDGKQPPASTIDEAKESTGEKEDTTQKKCDSSYIQKEPINIIVNVPEKKDNSTIIPNIIAFGMLIVTVFLTWYTYQLFLKTRDSVKVAQDALTDSRKKDSTAGIAQLKKDSIDSIVRVRDSKRDEINTSLTRKSISDQAKANREIQKKDQFLIENAEKSLKIQSQSIEETQRQFEVANKPYLQIANFPAPILKAEDILKVRLNVKNLGRYPAQIIEDVIICRLKKQFPYPDSSDQNRADAPTDYFKQITIVDNSDSAYIYGTTVTQKDCDEAINGTLYVYVYGFIKYKNLMTGNVYRYTFMAGMYLRNQIFGFIYNDNKFFKKGE